MNVSGVESLKVSDLTFHEVQSGENLDMNKLDRPYFFSDVSCDKRELSEQDKLSIKEESGWSNEIVNAIGSVTEYEIYKNAGVVEATVGEKACLIRPDIDMDQKDGFGRTNKERMEQGLAPLTTEGRPYELHHIGQHQDSPLAELTMQEHRGKGNDVILHIKTKESEIDRESFAFERAEHWNNRIGVVINEEAV